MTPEKIAHRLQKAKRRLEALCVFLRDSGFVFQNLDIALDWGGFPGLEHAGPEHTWPLSALRRAAAAPLSPASTLKN